MEVNAREWPRARGPATEVRAHEPATGIIREAVPVVLRHRGYTVFFFCDEGDPLEPIHVHVRGGGALAKFWVEPAVALAENHGFTAPQLREIEQLVRSNAASLARTRHDHFSG
jgi:hypothetical protein